MELIAKLAILSDAAKYDASCASSGAKGRNSTAGSGIGSTTGMGICHSYAPDGRCISLLKILLTNFCIYDCLYCVNRHSSNTQRARFSVDEVVNLCLEFYKRNYIEGLFLSSGIIRNPDYTMEQLVSVARELRQTHDFQGYIHLKTIPDADAQLLAQAGQYADRLSINIEVPSVKTLQHLAPEKNHQTIGQAMGLLDHHIKEAKTAHKDAKRIQKVHTLPRSAVSSTNNTTPVSPRALKSAEKTTRKSKLPRYAPGGQSTQMIIGADDSSDHKILATSARLYKGFGMRRVYYSAFSPIPDASKHLPLIAPPLLREHRLYQADWLMRFYGFDIQELVDEHSHNMLDLNVDPKLNWALRHREVFPLDINTASKEHLLRIPGLGPRNVQRILQSRRFHRLSLRDLQRMRAPLAKIKPFVITSDHRPDPGLLDSAHLRAYFEKPSAEQLALF